MSLKEPFLGMMEFKYSTIEIPELRRREINEN